MRLSLSSLHHPHHIHILYTEAVIRKCSWKLVFLKIPQISQEDTWFWVSFWSSSFTDYIRWLLLSILLFMNVYSSTSPLPHFHYFLTVLLLSSFEETLSSLCHYYYMINIIIAEWFIRITANAATYCTAISMIVKRISALMQFILKQTTKKPINKVQRKNIFSFRQVISLICQGCLISLNSVLSLTKQTQVYEKSTYKMDFKNDLITAGWCSYYHR